MMRPNLNDSTLILKNSVIDDVSFVSILRKCLKLKKLIIDGNWEISAETLIKINELKQLKYLSLSDTNIDDQVLNYLYFGKIEHLNFSLTNITNNGIFAVFVRAKNLKYLDVRDTKVTLSMVHTTHTYHLHILVKNNLRV